ncbi:MAG: tRNA (5-methylaminomethyl-2-thiouridine)(34)-methyltransferase MnmD [Bacteroidia bacterium]
MANNKNELKVIKTADGSFSIYNEFLDETYHSKHGALQESMHVFIKNGLNLLGIKDISILEVGFGTGLNAALTYLEAKKNNLKINYTALEPYPLSSEILKDLAAGYPENIAKQLIEFSKITDGISRPLTSHFAFTCFLNRVQTFNFIDKYDLIYFDAFAPEKQNDMWTLEIFIKLFEILKTGGLLSTYCAKGEVKRIMKQAGFRVKSFPGPPGKREMTVGYK